MKVKYKDTVKNVLDFNVRLRNLCLELHCLYLSTWTVLKTFYLWNVDLRDFNEQGVINLSRGKCLNIEQKSNVELLVEGFKCYLFPVFQSRIIRAEISQMRQGEDDSIENFARRIEDAPGSRRAFSDVLLRNEAFLSALIDGLRDSKVKEKLMEEKMSEFETATRIAVKQEHILEVVKGGRISVKVCEEKKPITVQCYVQQELVAVHKWEERKIIGVAHKCDKCNKFSHSTEKCWSDVRCQLCGVMGHVASVCKVNKFNGSSEQLGRNAHAQWGAHEKLKVRRVTEGIQKRRRGYSFEQRTEKRDYLQWVVENKLDFIVRSRTDNNSNKVLKESDVVIGNLRTDLIRKGKVLDGHHREMGKRNV